MEIRIKSHPIYSFVTINKNNNENSVNMERVARANAKVLNMLETITFREKKMM